MTHGLSFCNGRIHWDANPGAISPEPAEQPASCPNTGTNDAHPLISPSLHVEGEITEETLSFDHTLPSCTPSFPSRGDAARDTTTIETVDDEIRSTADAGSKNDARYYSGHAPGLGLTLEESQPRPEHPSELVPGSKPPLTGTTDSSSCADRAAITLSDFGLPHDGDAQVKPLHCAWDPSAFELPHAQDEAQPDVEMTPHNSLPVRTSSSEILTRRHHSAETTVCATSQPDREVFTKLLDSMFEHSTPPQPGLSITPTDPMTIDLQMDTCDVQPIPSLETIYNIREPAPVTPVENDKSTVLSDLPNANSEAPEVGTQGSTLTDVDIAESEDSSTTSMLDQDEEREVSRSVSGVRMVIAGIHVVNPDTEVEHRCGSDADVASKVRILVSIVVAGICYLIFVDGGEPHVNSST